MVLTSWWDDRTGRGRAPRAAEPAVEGEPGLRILHGPDELNDALQRAAQAEQRVRVELLRRYGHYYGRTDWSDFAAANRPARSERHDDPATTERSHRSEGSLQRWKPTG